MGKFLMFQNFLQALDFYFIFYQCNVTIVLSMHFNWLFLSTAYFKVCTEVHKTGCHVFMSVFDACTYVCASSYIEILYPYILYVHRHVCMVPPRGNVTLIQIYLLVISMLKCLQAWYNFHNMGHSTCQFIITGPH